MNEARVVIGPIRDIDVQIDPEVAAILHQRIQRLTPEEYDRMSRTIVFKTSSQWLRQFRN